MKRTLIIHHWDTDGICSTALLLNYLKGYIKNTTPEIGNYFLRYSEIEEYEDYESIVIADISIPREDVLKIKEKTNADIMIFDHHLQEEIKEVFHCNPILRGESPEIYPSTSWVINDYLKNPVSLLSVLGAVGDAGEKIRENEFIFQKIRENIDLRFEDLLKMTELIDSNYKINDRKGVENAVHYLLKNINHPERILENREWNKNLRKINVEIQKILEEPSLFEDDSLILKEFESDYSIISSIARNLAWNAKKTAIVINKGFFKDRDQIYVRGDGCLDRILELARERGYSSGGKKEVVGIVLPKEESEKFLDKILEELR